MKSEAIMCQAMHSKIFGTLSAFFLRNVSEQNKCRSSLSLCQPALASEADVGGFRVRNGYTTKK